MRQKVDEMSVETLEETNDLVTVLQVLHRNIAATQRSFLRWREEYKDVNGEFGGGAFLNDIKTTSGMPEEERITSDKGVSTEYEFTTDDLDHGELILPPETDNDCDVSMPDCDAREDESFEVTSLISDDDSNESDETSLDHLLHKLRKARDVLSTKNSEVQDAINGVRKEASEGCSLRERIGMNHRSLTLLERRQEKVMREALYENVTANTRIRQLQDEVIQLRIRDSQHQSDIQRLMAENSRLKLKLMENRSRTPGAPSLNDTTAPITSAAPPSDESPRATPVPLPGLLELEDLNRPVCDRVLQRATMSTADLTRQSELAEDITLHENTSKVRETRCPLCNRLPDFDDYDQFDDDLSDVMGPTTRSIGTCTADLQNIVSTRRTICFMGIYLPLPLFLAYFLQRIEETLAMVGQLCFSEIAPFDPSFPEVQVDFVQFMKSIHSKFHAYYRSKQD